MLICVAEADLANVSSRGLKRTRSPGPYDNPRLPGDEDGMLWQILCSLALRDDALLYTSAFGEVASYHIT